MVPVSMRCASRLPRVRFAHCGVVTATPTWDAVPSALLRLRSELGRALPGMRSAWIHSRRPTRGARASRESWCASDSDRERLARRVFFEQRQSVSGHDAAARARGCLAAACRSAGVASVGRNGWQSFADLRPADGTPRDHDAIAKLDATTRRVLSGGQHRFGGHRCRSRRGADGTACGRAARVHGVGTRRVMSGARSEVEKRARPDARRIASQRTDSGA